MQNQPTNVQEPVGFRIVYFYAGDIALTSLLDIQPAEYPVEKGNYFSLANPDNRPAECIRDMLGGPRVVNMWAENYKKLFRSVLTLGLPDTQLKVRALVFGTAPEWLALIEDDRVPVGYTTPYLYTVGGHQKYLKQVEAYSGLPTRN